MNANRIASLKKARSVLVLVVGLLLASLTGLPAADGTWTNTASGVTTTIQRSTNGTTWSNVTTTAANATTYTQSFVFRNTTYQYRIRSNNAFGSSAWVVVSITTP